MRIWLGLALVLMIAVGVVYGLGRRLPVEHRTVASGRVEASQDVVWALVADPATHTAWRKGVYKVVARPGENDCWGESSRSAELLLCVVDEAPKVRNVVRMVDLHGRFTGIWTYTLKPLGADATEVTVTEDDRIRSALWRFMGYYVMGQETHAKQFVEDLQVEAVRKR